MIKLIYNVNNLMLLIIFFLLMSCEKDSKEIIEEPKPKTPPEAAFTYSPKINGTIDSLFSFDANNCSDVNDETEKLSIRWDIGADGIFETNWSTNKIYKHKFKKEDLNSKAEAAVTLLIIDTDNMTDTLTQQVKFNIKPPSGEVLVTPKEGTQLTKFHFQTINVANDFESDSIKIRWDFGNDGSWSGWVWKNENKESYNFDFIKDGLSHDGEYDIVAEFQDQFGNATFDTVSIFLEKLPPYEIINVENNQVFSGSKSIVKVRILSPQKNYMHQLFVNDIHSSISSFIEQPDDTTHYLNLELRSTYYDDGNYILFAKYFYVSGGYAHEVYDSQKIPISIDNGGLSKLIVSSPGSSIISVPGEQVDIKWAPVSPNTNVNITLLGAVSDTYFKILKMNVPNTGQYAYKVDESIPTGEYVIYVNVTPETGGVGAGASDVFRISNPEPLEIVAFYGPFYEIADIEFLSGSSYIYALQSRDPWIRKISGNKIIDTKLFWENPSGAVPTYGGIAIDGSSVNSDFFVTRSASIDRDYPNIMKVSGTNPQNVIMGSKLHYTDGKPCYFMDVCIVGSSIYLLNDWEEKVWKLDKASFSIEKNYDLNSLKLDRDDILTGITFDGNNFWIAISNEHPSGSEFPQILKLDYNFNLLKRYNMPKDKTITSVEWNMNNGNLYMTTNDGIYKLAKE